MSRILLADDSITIQKVVNLTFADEGIEVIAVSNGDMAEKRLSEISPDLVLADIFMPGKNGYELCESIKQNPHFQNIPVVLLVGAFEPFDQSEAKRVRADAHLTKPFESRTLVETVRKLISSSSRVSAPLPAVKQASGPLETQPLPTPPPINIDFSAMSDQPAAPPPQETVSGFDFSSMPLAEAPPPIEIDVQPQPQTEAPSATLEFGSPFAPQPPFSTPPAQDFNLVFQDAAPVAPAETEAEPQARVPEVGKASAFGYSTPDIMLDFEKVDEPVAAEPENVVSYDVEIVSAVPENAVSYDAEVASEKAEHHLDTGKLEKSRPEPVSSGFAVIDQRVVEAASEPAYRVEGNVTTSLLTSESPLGDILLDERPSTEPIYQPDPEPILQSVIETDYFEQSPVEQQESEPVAWSDAEIQTSDAQVYQSEEDTQVVSFADAPAVPGFVEEKPFDFQSPDFIAPVYESGEPTMEAATEAQWDETTRELRSEDSDFEVAETQTMIFASEVPLSDTNQYADFRSSEMWTQQEAEAEMPAPQETVAAETVLDHETGFEFASAAAEPVQQAAEAEAADTQQPTQGEQVMQVVEIPESLIDEIVRRVVAQLSEAVVREIAWEVVPDCVERIVKEMSRDALQKK
ncbi:MAG: response regulator [Acidobacteriota bacterium]